jgi:hypothetical protein
MERCDGPWKTRAAILRSNGVQNEKRPPGNWAAFSSGRIVPTEASHQNFLGEYYGRLEGVSRLNPGCSQMVDNERFAILRRKQQIRLLFTVEATGCGIIPFISDK